MTEKLENGEKPLTKQSEPVRKKKRAYCTPKLIEETVFERAVLASCKVFGIDPSCETSSS